MINRFFSYPWRLVTLLAIAYFLIARAGLILATVNSSTSPIWPATGLAIGFLAVRGRQYWPGVFVGALAANLFTDATLGADIVIAIGNTLEGLIGAVILQRANRRSENLFGAVRFVGTIIASLLATPVSATCGTAALYFTGAIGRPAALETWITWWTGDTLGALFFTPFVFHLLTERSHFSPSRIRLPFVLAIAITSSIAIFFHSSGILYSLFLLYPVLFLATYLLKPIEVSLVSFSIAAVAIASTMTGKGPFFFGSTNDNLIFIAIFLGSVAISEQILRFIRDSGNLRLASIFLFVGWIIGGVVLRSSTQNEEIIDRSRFRRLVDQSMGNFSNRAFLYEAAIRGGTGLFHASTEVTPQEWSRYVKALEVDTHYPGILGLAYITLVKPENLQTFLKSLKAQAPAQVQFRSAGPVQPEPRPSGQPYFIVSGIEPLERNLTAIGLDLSADPFRYQSLAEAALSGHPSISGPLQLAHDPHVRKSFVLYYPLYRRLPKSAADRGIGPNLFGWIATPIVVEEFVRSALHVPESEIAFDFYYDDDSSGAAPLLSTKRSEAAQRIEPFDRKVIRLWDHDFIFHWTISPNFISRRDSGSAWVLFACAAMTVLLAAFISILDNLNRRANSIAIQKTRELAEREQVWRSLTQYAPVGIFRLDSDRRLAFANPLFQDLCPRAARDPSGWDFGSALDPVELPTFEKQWEALRNHRIDRIQLQTRLGVECNAEPREVWVALSLVELRHDDQVVGYMGTIQDLSEIRAQQAKLEHSSRLATLGQMAGGIAHEINNPLTILSGRAQLLAKKAESGEPTPESVLESCAKILETVTRIAKIVNGLRSFSRSGDSDPFHATSLGKIYENTVDFCTERFRTLKIDFRSEAPPALELVCREVQVVQVLLNLLNNAADAVLPMENRWIRFRTEVTPDEVQFIITDSGAPIPDWVSRNMMNPFFTTKPVGKGTGLGLSISNGIAEDHEGSLKYRAGNTNTEFVFSVSRHLPEGERPRSPRLLGPARRS